MAKKRVILDVRDFGLNIGQRVINHLGEKWAVSGAFKYLGEDRIFIETSSGSGRGTNSHIENISTKADT